MAQARTLGLLLAGLSAVAFSFKAVFVKLGLAHGADALTLLALRMGFALPVFLFMAWRSGAGGLTRRDWLWLAALGAVGYYLSSLFDFLGLQYISVGLERMILFTYPTLVALFSALFFGHAIRPAAWGALALSYIGIGLAVSHDLAFAGASRELIAGSLWVFASAVSYALFWMGSGHVVMRVGATRMTAFVSIFACLFVLGHFAIAHPLASLAAPMPVYIDALALALLCTVLPIWLQAGALRRIDAPTAALIGTLGPVITILLGWWILGEAMSLTQFAGLSLVVAGVLLVGAKPT
ncbi:MAG: DMT family transporter [Zoogloeaceae bacterium]|jgi:drug/metabolite transporter (DMT)-like permease|nr:DMT family transporter [Zoogloeaceae bacterium]